MNIGKLFKMKKKNGKKAHTQRIKYKMFFLYLVFSLNFFSYAQTNTQTKIAEPYGPAEFPPWISDMRRAEIISFGSLPFVTFATSIYYDLFRYIEKGGDERYLPWPLKKSDKAIPLTQSEQKNIFFLSVGISVGIALVDFSIHAISRRVNERRAEQKEREAYDPIIIKPILEDYE
jgi:hypothetical protein